MIKKFIAKILKLTSKQNKDKKKCSAFYCPNCGKKIENSFIQSEKAIDKYFNFVYGFGICSCNYVFKIIYDQDKIVKIFPTNEKYNEVLLAKKLFEKSSNINISQYSYIDDTERKNF